MSPSSLPSRISFFCDAIFARASVSTCSSIFSSAFRMFTISVRIVSRSSTKSTCGLETRKSMTRWESLTVFSRLRRMKAPSLTEDQLPFPCQVAFDLLEHLLVGDARAAHFFGVLPQDFAFLFVQPVLDRHFVSHHLAYLLRHVLHVLDSNHLGGEQALHHFLRHVADIIPRQ